VVAAHWSTAVGGTRVYQDYETTVNENDRTIILSVMYVTRGVHDLHGTRYRWYTVFKLNRYSEVPSVLW